MDTPAYNVGDLVVWMGMEMVVVDIKPNGDIEALSPTMRVQAPASAFNTFTS